MKTLAQQAAEYCEAAYRRGYMHGAERGKDAAVNLMYWRFMVPESDSPSPDGLHDGDSLSRHSGVVRIVEQAALVDLAEIDPRYTPEDESKDAPNEGIRDIVATLRECAKHSREVEGDYYADQFAIVASVFDGAADEIERLRPAYATAVQRLAHETGRLRLTDAERAVIEAILVDPDSAPADSAATLRGLLERLK